MPNYEQELNLYKYDPAADEDLTFNFDDGLNNNWDKIGAAFKARIKAAVADIATLKAIAAEARAGDTMVLVRAKGLYRFDAGSVEAGDDNYIVVPTAGTGRWIKIAEITAKGHLIDPMPHQFIDAAAGKTYKYGFKQQDNHLIFTYQEVL
jgi:hypothetical protein